MKNKMKKETNSEWINIRVSDAHKGLKARLKKVANKRRRSVNWLAQELINEALNKPINIQDSDAD